MRASQDIIEYIKQFELLALVAYLCPAGVWTIGYGHTKDVHPEDTITQYLAEQLLEVDLSECEEAIEMYVEPPLLQHQFDALVSFIFNIGVPAFRGSTMLSRLNVGRFDDAAAQFARWNKGGGKVLPGLVRRRAEEAAWFRGEM